MRYRPESAIEGAKYVAHTDIAVTAVTAGDYALAIRNLEIGYKYAPSDLERARNRALLGVISAEVLGGNIGEVQSLGYMTRAFQHWPLAQKGDRIKIDDASTAVDDWLYHELRIAFFHRQKQYPVFSKILAFDVLPSKFTVPRAPAEDIVYVRRANPGEASLISAEANQIVLLAQSSQDNASLQTQFVARYGSSSATRRWIAETLLSKVGEDWAFLSTSHSDVRLKEATDWAIDQLDEPLKHRFKNVSQTMHLILKMQSRSQESRDILEVLQQLAGLSDFPRLTEYFREAAAEDDNKSDNEKTTKALSRPPASPWWDRDYLDWFVVTACDLKSNFTLACRRSNAGCGDLLKNVDVLWQRDRGGAGVYFAPGIALVLADAEFFGLNANDDWRVIYKETTGADFYLPDFGTRRVSSKSKPNSKHISR